MEKLADENGFQYGQFIDFTKDLSKDFTKQINKNGYEEWVSVKTHPNHSIDCSSPIVVNTLAYEFANGFMIFGERDSMYD